jgi:hypothetical protein
MVIVSADVTDPHTPPFIVATKVVNNSDGSVSFELSDGRFAGQEPNVYGVRNDNAGIGAYQKFTLSGNLVISQTRPGDAVFVYTVAVGVSY